MTDYIALADKLADYANGDEFQRPVEEAERLIRALAAPAPDYVALADKMSAALDSAYPREEIAMDDVLAAEQAMRAFAARIAQAAPEASYQNLRNFVIGALGEKALSEFDRLSAGDAARTALSVAPSQDREDAQIDAALASPIAAGESVRWHLEHAFPDDSEEVRSIMVREIARTILAARQAPKEQI